MMSVYSELGAYYAMFLKRVRKEVTGFIWEERGDLVSSLGWMAIMALALVVVKGLIDGKLVGYVNAVFTHLDRVFNA